MLNSLCYYEITSLRQSLHYVNNILRAVSWNFISNKYGLETRVLVKWYRDKKKELIKQGLIEVKETL